MKSTTFFRSNQAKTIWRNVAVAVFAVCFALLGLCVTIIPSGATDEDSYTVGEIYGQHANVQHLYDLITGKSNATYADVVAAASTVTNAADIRNYNNDNDIKVTFGGREWYAVYLSETMDGRPILTLYLVNPLDNLKSKFADSTSLPGTDIATCEYPSSMYGVSVVRTITLNNGGLCRQRDDAHANEVAKDENHQLAALTISTQPGNYCAAIITPSEVEWQKNGYDYTAAYLMPNEGWGKVTDGNWMDDFNNYYYGSMNITGKTHYADWQNDTLWLPSVHELAEGGIWQLSNDQRVSSVNSWTRSSSAGGIDRAVALTATGDFWETGDDVTNGGAVTHELSVRPALHIDLSATALMADWDEEPADVTVAYNATNQTIEQMTNKPSWYDDAMTITYSKDGVPVTEVKDAGVYTATVKLNDMTKDITLTVTPQAITVNGITANNKTYDRTQSVTFDTSGIGFTGKYYIDELSVICTGKFADKNVGTGKAVTATVTLTGAAAHNYVLTNPELNLTADITPQTVVVSGVTVNAKEYDNTTRANLNTQNINFTGKLAGDDLTVAVSGEYATKTVANGITVTLSYHLDGVDAANYQIASSSQETAIGNITPRLITVTANDQTVKVGAPLNLSARVTSGSLASGDTAENVYALLIAVPTDPDAENVIDPDNLPVGEYTVKGECINDNYDITFVDGKYTVLTAEAWDALQTKDDEEPKDNNFWLVIVIVIAVAAFIGTLVGIGLVVRSHDKNRDPKPVKEKKVKKDKQNKKEPQPTDATPSK